MPFGIFIDPIDSGINLLSAIASGEEICREDVVKLLDAGMTIAAIAAGVGVGVDVIESLLEDKT